MAVLLSSESIGAHIADHLGEIESINDFAQSEDRDLTSEESQRQTELLNEVEASTERLERAKQYEQFKKARAAKPSAAPRAVSPGVSQEDRPEWKAPRAQRSRNWRMRAFTGPHAADNAYAAGMEILAQAGSQNAQGWCQDHGIKAAQTEGTDSQGGYLTPSPLSDSIIEYREAVGVARQICDVVSMDSDAFTVPKLTSGQTVYYPAENASITASDTAFSSVNLAATRRAVLTHVSRQLSADAIINMADRVASRAGYALAQREDQELIQGDGTASWGSVNGITSAMGGIGEVTGAGNAWSELTLNNFYDLMGKLGDHHHDGASFLCSRPFFHSVMERLMFGVGGTTVDAVRGGSSRQFFGYPVNFTSAMPVVEGDSQRCVYFGNFKNSVILGSRSGVEVATSEDFSFDKDLISVRVQSRYDIQVHNAADGASVGDGGIVAIETAAS